MRRRLVTMTDRTDLCFKWLVPRAELKFQSLCLKLLVIAQRWSCGLAAPWDPVSHGKMALDRAVWHHFCINSLLSYGMNQ